MAPTRGHTCASPGERGNYPHTGFPMARCVQHAARAENTTQTSNQKLHGSKAKRAPQNSCPWWRPQSGAVPKKKFHSNLMRVPKRFLASLVLKARIFQGRHGGMGSPDRGARQSTGPKLGDPMGNQVPVLLSGHISPNKVKSTFYIEPGTNLQCFPLGHLILCSWKGLLWNKWRWKRMGVVDFWVIFKMFSHPAFLFAPWKPLEGVTSILRRTRT